MRHHEKHRMTIGEGPYVMYTVNLEEMTNDV